MIYQVYQHTEKVVKYKKNAKEKSESVTVPRSLKRLNLKWNVFSTLIQFIHELAPLNLCFRADLYAVFEKFVLQTH